MRGRHAEEMIGGRGGKWNKLGQTTAAHAHRCRRNQARADAKRRRTPAMASESVAEVTGEAVTEADASVG